MQCPQCDGELSDDVTQCFHCGLDLQSDQIILRVSGYHGNMEPPNAEYWARVERQRAQSKRYSEGRGLERAGDIAAAIAIYEELVTGGYEFFWPYERLAIMYRKARRAADEERVVRAALAAIGASHRQEWFSSRLSKLIVKRGIRELTEPSQ